MGAETPNHRTSDQKGVPEAIKRVAIQCAGRLRIVTSNLMQGNPTAELPDLAQVPGPKDP